MTPIWPMTYNLPNKKYLQLEKIPHARYVVIIEACEESGSPDLLYYCGKLEKEIGLPDFVICLDSGCLNYEQLWVTTSLRGVVMGKLKVQVLEEALHSGLGSGIVPDSFRILRKLISRLEDEETGKVVDDFYVEIPEQRLKQAKEAIKYIGDEIWNRFKFFENTTPITKDNLELFLNQTWRPQLTVTGQSGFPDINKAGNVLRSYTTLKISLRIPPTLNADKAIEKMKTILEKDPPYGSKVLFTEPHVGGGWNAPKFEEWLTNSLENSSKTYFNKSAGYFGEGGSIPFMGDLGRKYPKAQFCVIGLLGPGSNAHSVNEFLHIPFAKKLNCCVISLLYDHANKKE